MRLQDENKKHQIYVATAHLINEIGFTNVSMSKIANEAGLSKANLYTYFKDKEDMFEQTYIFFKRQMLSSCLENIGTQNTIYDSIMQFCNNLLSFIRSNEVRFLFLEQCNSEPRLKSIENEEINNLMNQHIKFFQKGIDEKVLKDTHPLLLISFCVYSITQIYKEFHTATSLFEDIDFEQVFQMSWDAIKR